MTDIVADFELQPQPQIDADFNILEEETINAEFVLPNAMYHDRLEHRDYPDQHPISAITDLAETLSEISSSVEDEKIRAETVEGDLNDLTTSEKSNLVGAINELDSSKQNNLTAGLGIDITNNEVGVTTPTLINSATGTNSLTVLGTSASQNGITNVGVSAEGTATNATAVGYSSSAEGAASTAIGKGANAHATRSIALGALSVASGDYSIAIGSHNSLYSSSARATAQSAIQLGNGTNSTSNTFQVGSYTLLNTSTGIIPNDRIDIDSIPTENSTNTVSSGGVYSKQGDLTTLTTTDKTNLVSAINELDSDKQENITAGTGIDITSNIVSVTDPTLLNNGTGTKALAVGKLSQSTAEGGLAVGYGARANSTYGTAVGYEARANNTNTTAIGKGAEATQQRAIAIGSGAEANAQDAIAIKGINNTANTMQVYTYTLLDMATGLIPNARIDIDSTPTANSTNTVSSGGTYTMVNDVITGTTDIDYDNTTSGLSSNTVKGAIDELASDVSDIDSLIPNQASSTNQLADKDFVNSSIATNTANFIGTFNSVAELEAYSGTVTNNDYAFVVGTDSAGNTVYDRYKYTDATTPASWIFEYELNNSSFTAAQWNAINSGATTALVNQITTNQGNITTIQTTIGGYGNIVTHNVSEFATAAQGTKADTAVQPADLATVATSGSYNDLDDKPTIGNATLTIQKNGTAVDTFTANATSDKSINIIVPTDTSDLTNGAGYITGITSTDVTTALGYTPYNASNPDGYTTNIGTVTSVNNTSPDGSGNVTLSIPTVNDSTITITQGGVTKGSFTLNQASGDTIALDAGGSLVDIDNKSITTNASDQLQTVGVIDQNNTSTAIKTWTGTKVQYDAIVSGGTVDSNTLYNTDNGLFLGTTQIANLSSVRNIGEFIQSTIPLTDAGLHLLDGSLISGSGSYADFVTYMAGIVSSYPDLFTTEADWQTSVTNYGVCGKFVYDSVNNTVRLPKRTSEHGDLIKSYKSGSDWYRIYSDGWCEQGGSTGLLGANSYTRNTVTFLKEFVDTNYTITTSANKYSTQNGLSAAYPPFIYTKNTATCVFGGYCWTDGFDWVASGFIDVSDLELSPVYEYIVIATSVKTEIEVDIDEIATDLNGKADVGLTNCTKPHVVETYVNGTSWYRVYSDGWCEQGGYANAVSTDYQTCEIVFLKEFIDTNYVFLHENNTTNWSTTVNGVPAYTDKTTASIKIFAYSPYTNGSNWRACGYIS